ncbi:hypothetical protein FE257_007686 [Aspergillus nanangensis]|uniref:Uncharacterized protein n=1 Tax=Aspergillus nanangensis TaxID=2582783 RepID=A0AAD4CWT5_ASPNN|nr:hypothetical protein FE257_007686 [Aspergillus nanangensis]
MTFAPAVQATLGQFLSTCLIYGTAFHLWSSFVLLQFDDKLHDVEPAPEPSADSEDSTRGHRKRIESSDNEHHENSADEADDSDPMFIPLGWPRTDQGDLYAASDPEWQEFLELSRDREKLQALRDITEKGVTWTTQPMSSEDGDLIRKCMRPLFVALGIRDAYTTFFKRQLGRLNIIEQDQGLDTAQQRHQMKGVPTDLRTLDGLSRLSQADTSGPTSGLSSSGSEQKTSQESEDSSLHPSFLLSTLQRLPMPKFGPGSDLYAASLAFKMRLNDCWARELHTPPRGVLYFLGPVGLKGPKGFCRVEVTGEYDPATATWTLVSLQLKDLSLFNQRALGGG